MTINQPGAGGQNNANASAEQKVTAGTSYVVALKFQGDARYTIAEYGPDGAGGWTKTKDIQTDGDSTDPQHDSYNMTPIPNGQVCLVRIKANMEAVSSGSAVSTTETTTSSGKALATVTAGGTYSGDPVPLSINLVVSGS